MKFDLLTLTAVSMVIAAVNALFFLCIWHLNKTSNGIVHWTTAILCFPLVIYLANFTQLPSVGLVQFSTYLIGITAAIATVIGCRKFFGFNRNNLLIATLLFVPFTLCFSYFFFVKPDDSLRLLTIEMLAITSLLIILAITLAPQLPGHHAGRILLICLTMALIGLISLQLYNQSHHLIVSNPTTVLEIPITAIVLLGHYGLTMCFTILCHESRLQQLIKPQQSTQDISMEIDTSDNNQLETEPEDDQPIRIEPTLSEEPIDQEENNQQTHIKEVPPELTDNNIKQEKRSPEPQVQPTGPQLLNINSLLRQQKKLSEQQFDQLIEQLPQRLNQRSLNAKKEHLANQFDKLASELHQLATLADNIGLDKLADMALQLELSPSNAITTKSFSELSQLCQSSINQLQQQLIHNGEEKHSNS